MYAFWLSTPEPSDHVRVQLASGRWQSLIFQELIIAV